MSLRTAASTASGLSPRRCRQRHGHRPLAAVALALLVLLVSQAGTAVAASTVGFDATFIVSSAPFAVVECDAVCKSPGTVTFQLRLVRTGTLSATDTVLVSTRPSSDSNARSATAGDDYSALAGVPVKFDPSESAKTVVVTVISDGVYEEDEYFEAVVASQSSGVSIDENAKVAYIKIVDGGDAGLFSFSASTYTFAEDAGLVQVKVVRAGGASGTVTVTYRLANPGQATAINAKNFQLTDPIYQLKFEDAQREAFIPIRIINDALYEAQEFFYLELSALSPTKANDATASVAKFGATRTAVVFIADDGDAGRFDFAAPFIFCREDNGSAVVSIVRSLGASSSYTPVTLSVATVGTSGGSNATEGGSFAFDYQATSDKLTWANDETRKTFAVKIFNNNKYEPVTRAFKIRMTAVDGGASIGSRSEIWVYIVDDRDAGTLSFKQAQYEVLENAGSVTVEIVRTGLADASGMNTYTNGSVSVEVATYAGTILPGKQKYDDDYDNGVVQTRKCTHLSPCTAAANVAYTPLVSTTITFADGEKSKTVTIPILDDTLFEAPDQVFKVTMRNAAGGAHIGIDYEHPGEWFGYRTVLLETDKRRNELPDFVGTIVTIKDDGDPAVLVSKASLSVSEIGQSDNMDVWLNSAPPADVTVTFSCVATEVKLSVSTLKFTTSNWATRQTVVVTAVANKRTQGLPKGTITMAVSSTAPLYNGRLRQSLAQTSGFTFGTKIYTQKPGTYDTGNAQHAFPWVESFGVMTSPQAKQEIAVFILDDDPAGVVVSPEGVRHLSASVISPQNNVAVRMNGHKAALGISLSTEPAGNVKLSLAAVADDGIRVSAPTLTFTPSNWNVAQPVEIEAVASSRSNIDSGVYYSSVRVLSTSATDSFYNQPDAAMATIFVARYPVAVVLLDASLMTIRENEVSGPGFASYQVRLGSEPMHWEPGGSQQYKPLELVLPAKADTMLTLSSDTAISATAAAGDSATFSVAANASISSTATRIVRIGVVKFIMNPAIASATGSHQVGGAKLRLYRVSGGENGGLGGVKVGVAVAEGSVAETWHESWLRVDCVSNANANIQCSLRNTETTESLPLSALFPAPSSFVNIRSATAGETLIQPTGTFDTTANTYTPAPGWVEIDVTVAVNAFLAKQHKAQQSQQSFAKELTFLVYTMAPTFFAYDGATEVTFASKDHSDASLWPELQVLGSGRMNLAGSASVSQSHPGAAQAAIDGQATSNLGVAATFAMSSTVYKYPWWQADLGSLRLVDEVIVTIKRKVSAASLTSAQLPVSVWLLLSDKPLADTTTDGVAGFTAAKQNAQFAKRFDVVGRSFTASEIENIVIRWRVFGAQGVAAFGDDDFQVDYTATVEARYFLLQVDGENNVGLNEVEIFQPALASTKISLGGYMPSPSVVNKGKNQISFRLEQPGEQASGDCDAKTAICRNELLFTSGNWWEPQTVRVSVVDDAVATGDRNILLTHTLQSSDTAFHGTSVCTAAATAPCQPGLFNESGVKTLRVLDDDENVVLFSASALEVEEGSAVYPNAPIVRREQQVFPASMRCSSDATRIIHTPGGRSSDPAPCGDAFTDAVPTESRETCIASPSASTLASGSAWLMAGFAESDVYVTEIVLTIPQMLGAKYARRISLWWSDSLDINASTPLTLLDISQSWTKIRSVDIAMISSGQQTIRTSDLALASIKILLIAFDTSYDDVENCLMVPSITFRARVALPFPLAVRGDLTTVHSVAPHESNRSRMHQVGKTAKLRVRLASEPVQDVTISVVADTENAPLTIFTGSPLSAAAQGALVGGQYESGELVTFSASTALLFTPKNWNVTHELTFLAVDDNTYNANRTFSVSHGATSTESTAAVIPQQTFQNNKITRSFVVVSPELAYTQALFTVATERQAAWPQTWTPQWVSGRGTVEVLVIDDDLPGITVSSSAVVISESAIVPGNYSIALDSAPTSDVVVSISYEFDTSLLAVSPLRLKFSRTDWKTPQFVFITPVPNEIYDAGAPLTVGYDRLVAKKSQPVLKHKVASAKDAVYDGLVVGGNEPDRAMTAYVGNQGVVVVVQDDDTGCPREYNCRNGGECANVTYGDRVGTSSASVCRCPATFGMRDCGADCANERACTFSRVVVLLRCQPGDPLAICGDVFSPARLVSTLYRMLTTDGLRTPSGKTFPKLSIGPMAETVYIVNATTAACVNPTGSTSVCVQVTMDFSKVAGSTLNPVIEKLQGYLESGSLQTQPLYVELLTATQQYPQNLGATIAVWIFVGFCAASIGGVVTLFSVRYVTVKRFHVQPDLGGHEVTEPLTGATNLHAQ